MILMMMALALEPPAAEGARAATSVSTAGMLVASMTQSNSSTGQTDRYQYDALGRLVEVATEVQDTVQTRVTYAYDAAGNRTQQTTVSTASATPARTRVVVLPLAGFTIIPIRTNP